MSDRTNGPQLDDALHAQIKALCKEGDVRADAGDYDGAVERYLAGWALLPGEKARWEAATWILAAIGDAHFLAGRFDKAANVLTSALVSDAPGAAENPFIHLRLGQSLFELGERHREKALDELARAYVAGGGKRIFEREDPKYLEALSKVMAPPAGRSSL